MLRSRDGSVNGADIGRDRLRDEGPLDPSSEILKAGNGSTEPHLSVAQDYLH
jgi:hypothetical protein